MSSPGAPLDFFKSVTWLANVGHVLAGYGALLTVGFWSANLLTAWAVLLVYVVLKEYVLDLMYESGETWLSSTFDALGYLAGAGAATAQVLLR